MEMASGSGIAAETQRKSCILIQKLFYTFSFHCIISIAIARDMASKAISGDETAAAKK